MPRAKAAAEGSSKPSPAEGSSKGKEPAVDTAAAQAQQEAATDGIDNFDLPRALVTRIAKSALPDNAKLQKDTVTALQKGSTVFINYLAATAHDVALSRSHKNITATDILKALDLIEFNEIAAMLGPELEAYRKLTAAKKKGKTAAPSDASSKAGPSKGKGKATSASPASKGKMKAKGDNMEVDQDDELTPDPVEDQDGAEPDEGTARTEGEDEAGEDEGEGAQVDDDDDEDLEDGDDDADEEDEEPVDAIELEEQEMAADARGLDDTERMVEE